MKAQLMNAQLVKAQLSIEYIIALLIFITFASYIAFRLITQTPIYLGELKSEIVRSEAYQVSELLINDPGEPTDWHQQPDASIDRIGLSDETAGKTNLLSVAKLNALRTKCDEGKYEMVKNWIDTDHQFYLLIVDKTGTIEPIECKPEVVVTRAVNVTVRRIAAFDSAYAELILQMW